MPGALLAEGHGIRAVTAFGSFINDLLERAETVKPTTTIEPPLNNADFQDLLSRGREILSSYETKEPVGDADALKNRRLGVAETAVRDAFTKIIATTAIESPDFVRAWNLLDIVSILEQAKLCDPALVFWLTEELLDGQTIIACREIFQFLESRREQLTANLGSKKLVILRTCNELLRRLSRAEDAAFCGRIFIFMFQSFPLGDKSSVNLRGEYHIENVTTYDEVTAKDGESEKMVLDNPPNEPIRPTLTSSQKSSKAGLLDAKKALSPDALYPLFWGLQASFSQPKRLFEAENLASFKTDLEATMNTFLQIAQQQKAAARSAEKVEESRSVARQNRENEAGLSGGFNPKYLTSRDLFELEMGDLSFRRHVLVQALIILDFLLSLSTKAKEKLAAFKAKNKSVTYADQVLCEEDAVWATEMRASVADYLKTGLDGPYFYRLVSTVLSRDKNWVRWKCENCPPIAMASVTPEAFRDAKAAAKKMTTNKRLRPTPLQSLPLNFLNYDTENVMEKYQSPERYKLPELSSFKRKIQEDDLEIEMPINAQTKAAAIKAKASKSWRALRIASKFRLIAFDKIDNDDKIDVIFEEPPVEDVEEEIVEEEAGDVTFPEDQSPTVVVDSTRSILDDNTRV